jgi:DNA-binding NarL/FixJ family response regulator
MVPTSPPFSSRNAIESTGFTHDFKDATLTAGLLDIHMHGAVGHDVMEGTSEALRAVSVFLARHGVTEYLATTVTAYFAAGCSDSWSKDAINRAYSPSTRNCSYFPSGMT